MTLEQLADRIGRSKAWLSMVENGRRTLDRRSDIAALAETLEVSADALIGEPAPEVRAGREPWNLRPLRAVLLDTFPDDPPDLPARPVSQLRELYRLVDAALRRADYDTMQRYLPALLGELQVRAATSAEPERGESLRLVILASASASIMLRHFGLTDLAWVAARQGRRAAVLLADPVWSAAAAFQVAHAQCSVDKPRALLSTPRIADELEPLAGRGEFARDVYGMLRLSAALACAVQGDHGSAARHGAEAAAVAAKTGDRPDAWELFGPANVGVWRASLAVEAGNAEEALRHAAAIEPRVLASGNRRAALRIERSRALVMLGGHDGEAIAELRHAERLSPQQVHNHPVIREQVTGMLERARRDTRARDLRGLAWRMGII